MSRSHWNDIDRRNNGELRGDCDRANQPHRNNLSRRRLYPTIQASSLSPAKSQPYNESSFSTRGSESNAAASNASLKRPPPPPPPPHSETPQTTGQNTNGSHSSFSMANESFSRSPYERVLNDSTSTSESSFYETLREEAASCCPVCGFQVLEAPHNNNGGGEFLTATALASVGATAASHHHENSSSHLPPSVWLRSLVVHQQEHLLNGCHVTESAPGGFASALEQQEAMLPSATCLFCLQAAQKAAKAKQVEEDRMLAASLSKIILEEQQQQQQDQPAEYCPPSSHHYEYHQTIIHSSRNDKNYNANAVDNPIALSGDHYASHLGSSANNMSQHYRPQEGLYRQEWPEDEHLPMPTGPTPALKEGHFEEGCESLHRNRDHYCATACQRNALANHDCNSDKNHVNVNDDSCVYIGEYNILGQRHGSRGELIWDNGDRYVGTFKNGMRSGQGAFFFRDGSEYTGDWKENLMHGFGQCKFANGDTYVGQYHKGQRSGGPNGKYKFANSDLYVGAWDKDRFHGFGRYFFADGSVLEGTFVHGIKHGKFKRQLPTEDLDILRFEDDKIVGKGVRWNTKRTKTWLLELNMGHKEITRTPPTSSKKNSCRRTAIRMVRGIGSLTRSRQKKAVSYLPSSVGVADRTTAEEGNPANGFSFSASLSGSTSSRSSFPHEKLVPVLPQGITKNIVKKSVRIPISQAVSIGYDCEIGTGARPSPVVVR